MLVLPEVDTPQYLTTLQAVAAIVLNANIEIPVTEKDLAVAEPDRLTPSLLTCQGGKQTSHV